MVTIPAIDCEFSPPEYGAKGYLANHGSTATWRLGFPRPRHPGPRSLSSAPDVGHRRAAAVRGRHPSTIFYSRALMFAAQYLNVARHGHEVLVVSPCSPIHLRSRSSGIGYTERFDDRGKPKLKCVGRAVDGKPPHLHGRRCCRRSGDPSGEGFLELLLLEGDSYLRSFNLAKAFVRAPGCPTHHTFAGAAFDRHPPCVG
jgi:hypothetical protein